MALNYAETYSPELLEILMQGALTSPFVTDNVRWLDAKTFHFTQMSTSGYNCLLYTSPSPRDRTRSRMPSSA